MLVTNTTGLDRSSDTEMGAVEELADDSVPVFNLPVGSTFGTVIDALWCRICSPGDSHQSQKFTCFSG